MVFFRAHSQVHGSELMLTRSLIPKQRCCNMAFFIMLILSQRNCWSKSSLVADHNYLWISARSAYHSYPWFWEVGINKCQQWTHNTQLWCQEHGVVYNWLFIFVFLYAHFFRIKGKSGRYLSRWGYNTSSKSGSLYVISQIL